VSVSLFIGRRVMWMGATWRPSTPAIAFCCEDMTDAIAFDCDQHADPFECNDQLVVYNEVFDEYGVVVHDGGASYVLLSFCPWCGTKLPESQRDRWFDETEALGNPDILPARYETAEWRLKRPE
jgi:hypothetical protein